MFGLIFLLLYLKEELLGYSPSCAWDDLAPW